MNQSAKTLTILLVLVCAILIPGCGSLGQPASASFASVVIANRSVEQIQQTTAAVFQENGYRGRRSPDGMLVFEKEGSRADTIARDGLVAAQSGAVTLVRVKTEVVELGSGSRRLQGQAYMVTGAGDSFFEDEVRLTNFRSGPYQKLLNEVAKRLK